MEKKQELIGKIGFIILLILSLLLFPNPEQNFFIYLPWLIISIIIMIKLVKSMSK